MKRFKKLTAGFLGVVMALSVCSFTALAEEYVAQIGDTKYEKLAYAIDAAKTDKKGCTIVLLGDVEENGFKAEDGDEFTIDFNGFTYTIKGLVGSTGTETNGMQLLKGSDITLKNGTIKSETAEILIQKYGTLKIDDMDLIGGVNCQYVISNNNGITTITGETNITAKEGWYAFDVYYWPSNGYSDVEVIFDEDMTGTVEGKVQYARDNADDENWLNMAKLTIESGNFEIEIDDQSEGHNASIEIVSGSFTSDVSDYLASDSAFVKDEDGNYVVVDEDEIKDAKFYIANEDDLKEAIANQADGVTWVLKDSFEVKERIKITKNNVTFDGNGKTLTFATDISGAGNGNNSFIEINDVEGIVIKDINLDGNNKVHHGINIFTHADKTQAELEVDNVVIENCKGYAITNNASKVTVTDLETSGNGWGGINVDNSTSGDDCGAELIINNANIKDSNSVKIENANNKNIDAVIKDGTYAGDVFIADGVENAELRIISGTFAKDVEKYIDKDSHLVEDKDGNFVVMDEEEYEDYLDSKKPSHSYELEEGRVERDDEDDEKNEPVVTPEEEAGPFSDVGKDNPNYDAIIKVYENGWMAGIGDGVFAPNGTLTRAMGATVLWNKAGKPEPQNVAPFLDVTSDDWYAKAVAWAYEQGIVAGYGDVFGPDDALTTEQFTRMNDIANGKTPEIYVGGAPNATRGWVASLLAM